MKVWVKMCWSKMKLHKFPLQNPFCLLNKSPSSKETKLHKDSSILPVKNTSIIIIAGTQGKEVL